MLCTNTQATDHPPKQGALQKSTLYMDNLTLFKRVPIIYLAKRLHILLVHNSMNMDRKQQTSRPGLGAGTSEIAIFS